MPTSNDNWWVLLQSSTSQAQVVYAVLTCSSAPWMMPMQKQKGLGFLLEICSQCKAV